jgi:hypothetical protein
MAMTHRPGQRWADMNACRVKDGDVNLHWPESMYKNGFTHIIDAVTGKIRLMTPAELHRPLEAWTLEEAKRCRRRLPNGRWIRVFSVPERTRQAAWRRVKIAWELKSIQYGTDPAIAQSFVKSLRAKGLRNWCVMTLVSMFAWQGKMEYFHKAGSLTALLAHNQPKPKDLPVYLPYIDRVWDHWA